MLKTRIEGGKPPDLAMLAQPTPVLAYAAAGKVIDVAHVHGCRRSSPMSIRPPSAWSPRASNIWGIPYKADVKSTIWYPIKAFEAKGYTVPTTWDELIALSDKIVADGSNPWCVSAGGPGDATGWQLTDWVEEVVLKTKGLDYYNEWISHKVPFQDPGIKDAFDKTSARSSSRRTTSSAATPRSCHQDQKTTMDPMFTDDLAQPEVLDAEDPDLVRPGLLPGSAGQRRQPSKYVIGDGRRHLPVPDHRPGPEERRGLGRHAHGARRPARSPCRRRVPRHAARHPAVDQAGSAISANTTTPPSGMRAPTSSRSLSEIANNAAGIGFDASDLMPAEVGAGTFWTKMDDWVNNGGTNTDATLKAIDDSWPAQLDASDGLRGAPPNGGAPRYYVRGGGWDGRQLEAERPGLSRFVLPIAGLIGLGLCVGGILVLLDPQGGPNLLASIYDALGNTSGATDLRNGQGDQVIAKILLAVDRAGGRRRRHLAAVHRRRRAGRPAPAEVARPDPAVGLRRPGPGAAGGLPGLPRGGTILRSFQDDEGQFTLANYAVLARARVHRRSCATTSSG